MNSTGIGGFQNGQSGNPGGRPAELADVKALAREQTAASLATLAEIRDNPKSPAATRIAAANSLLDRGWGRPAQALEHSGPGGTGPLVARWLNESDESPVVGLPRPKTDVDEWARKHGAPGERGLVTLE